MPKRFEEWLVSAIGVIVVFILACAILSVLDDCQWMPGP
jgi:hypothetical protein